MKNLKTPIPLKLPVVPAADPTDGLLKTSDLEHEIRVLVNVWEAAEPEYYAQVVLNDELVGQVITITEDDRPGDEMAFNLGKELFALEGIYKLAYKISSPFSGLHEISDSIELRVDRTPPGAGLLSPVIFPDVTLGAHLTGQIPGYSGMQKGDIIRTVCNGIEGPTHTVASEELLDLPLSIRFDSQFLQSLNSLNVLIEYFVSDRAGNTSIMSNPKTLTLQI